MPLSRPRKNHGWQGRTTDMHTPTGASRLGTPSHVIRSAAREKTTDGKAEPRICALRPASVGSPRPRTSSAQPPEKKPRMARPNHGYAHSDRRQSACHALARHPLSRPRKNHGWQGRTTDMRTPTGVSRLATPSHVIRGSALPSAGQKKEPSGRRGTSVAITRVSPSFRGARWLRTRGSDQRRDPGALAAVAFSSKTQYFWPSRSAGSSQGRRAAEADSPNSSARSRRIGTLFP